MQPEISILPRAAWRAKPPLDETKRRPLGAIVRLTVHQSEGPCASGSAVEPTLRSIQHFHQHEPIKDETGDLLGLGLNDIAYHVLIDADGRLWEGVPMVFKGQHARKCNTGNIGICLLGKNRFGPLQTAALAGLLEHLLRRFGLSPEAVAGHRDVPPSQTDCPGDEITQWLALWRRSQTKEMTQHE